MAEQGDAVEQEHLLAKQRERESGERAIPSGYRDQESAICSEDEVASSCSGSSKGKLVDELVRQGQLAAPISGMNLLRSARSIVTLIFLGKLGPLELAGGSMAITMASVTGTSIIIGLGSAMDPLCGQAFGAKQYTRMGETLQRGITILLFATVPILSLWAYAKPILLLCGQDPSIASTAASVLHFLIPDLLLTACIMPLRVYLRSQSLTFPMMLCGLICTITHIPFNFLFVQWLDLGAPGAGIATCCTDLVMLASLVGYVRFGGVSEKCWGGWSLKACFRDWGPFLKLAAPSCINICLEWWCYDILLMLTGLLENPMHAVAAMSICFNVGGLAYMVGAAALSSAVSTRVGNELGANRPFTAKLASQSSLILGSMAGLISFIFITLFRKEVAWVFTDDSTLMSSVAKLLPVIGFSELIDAPQTALSGVLRGSARPSLGAAISLISYYAIGFPAALVLAFVAHLGIVGMWFGLIGAQAAQLLAMIVVVFRTDWMLQALKAKQLVAAEIVHVTKSEEVELAGGKEERQRTMNNCADVC